MEILRSIVLYTENRDMPFVVIGGHAINSYGISRHTADLDLIVPCQSKSKWQELFNKINYTENQSDQRFSRFRPANLDNWPIDLMYVDDQTFSQIHEDAKEDHFGEINCKVASYMHLIVLKLHSLKHYQEHRFVKDYSDLTSLIKLKNVNIEEEDFKEKCLKYATKELYDRLKNDLK